jgi:hypothetical protein
LLADQKVSAGGSYRNSAPGGGAGNTPDAWLFGHRNCRLDSFVLSLS